MTKTNLVVSCSLTCHPFASFRQWFCEWLRQFRDSFYWLRTIIPHAVIKVWLGNSCLIDHGFTASQRTGSRIVRRHANRGTTETMKLKQNACVKRAAYGTLNLGHGASLPTTVGLLWQVDMPVNVSSGKLVHMAGATHRKYYLGVLVGRVVGGEGNPVRDMKCTVHDLKVMGSKLNLVKIGVRGTSKLYLNQN